MFDEMTYENILNDMLSRVKSDVDKREGSIIYDAIAPAAYLLAETYFMLNNYIDLFFIDTTVGEYLDRKVADYGINRKKATNTLRKIETTGVVNIGTRWGIEDIYYTVTERLTDTTYKSVCSEAGAIGNIYNGTLQTMDNISNVTANLTDIIESGADVETDDNLRDRIKQYLINPSQDGNSAQYLKWATEYEGAGRAKVFPLWNGGNTVKISITNSEFKPAESSLVEKFQNYIDPEVSGLGNGVAPIGSKVTVTGGIKKDINITANIVLSEGYTEPLDAAKAISDYLNSIVYVKNSVSYMRIGSSLLDCLSIADLSNLKLNGQIIDVTLLGEEIPVLNSLNLVVLP